MTDPLSVAGSVVGIISLGIGVAKSLVDFYTTVKDQKSNVAYTTGKLERLLGTLEILHRQLTDRKFRADERGLLDNIEASIHACDEYIRELQTENDKFKDCSHDNIRAAGLTAARRLAYPFRQSTLQKLDEDIDETVLHLTLALQVLQQKNIGNVQDDIDDAKALLELVRADQISSGIRYWLKAPDASVEYYKACKKRYPSTGLWLVKDSSSFSSWLEKPNSFLWLSGFAGCGKSVLCSTSIQYAFRHRRSNPRIGIAFFFFFFVFDNESKQDTSAMLRALVLQLSSQLKDNHEILSCLHDRYRNTMPPDEALADCLRRLIRMFDDVYILLDALDESPRGKHREDVLQALVDLREWSQPGLHLLVTSRDEADIRDVLRDECGVLQDEVIAMKNDSINSDITSFISGSLKNDRRLRRWEKHHAQIEGELTNRAEGVFRWVECQLTVLYSCPVSKRQLDTLLASLPRSLDKTYERMLLNIPEESVEDASRILTMICCAKRPLTVRELIEGIAVELGDTPRLNPDGRLDNEDEIGRVCPGLIDVDMQQPSSGNSATVRIAHFSVQEYLESDRICLPNYSVRKQEAHTEMTCICLTYLLEPALSTSMDPEEYPLALYAAQTWHKHLRDGNESADLVQAQAFQLFQNTTSAFKNWVETWNVDSYDGSKPHGKVPSPVYYASLLGLDLILSKLLDGNTISARAPFSGSSVVGASAIVNAQAGDYGTALHAASEEGHEKIVRLLLEKGAEVNAQAGDYGTALHAASEEGHEKIVRLLLEKGAYRAGHSDSITTHLKDDTTQ